MQVMERTPLAAVIVIAQSVRPLLANGGSPHVDIVANAVLDTMQGAVGPVKSADDKNRVFGHCIVGILTRLVVVMQG